MKMLTEEQCGKCCPKMWLSWGAGALGCHHLVSSVHQAESSVGQDFLSHLHRPLSDCHFADIQGYYAHDIAPNSYLTVPCLVSLIREGRLGRVLG